MLQFRDTSAGTKPSHVFVERNDECWCLDISAKTTVMGLKRQIKDKKGIVTSSGLPSRGVCSKTGLGCRATAWDTETPLALWSLLDPSAEGKAC